MSKMVKKHSIRDYTKPIMLNLRGKKGFRAYVKMVMTPPTKYDAEAAKEEAAANLRKQGIYV